jgi:hypothetical protein
MLETERLGGSFPFGALRAVPSNQGGKVMSGGLKFNQSQKKDVDATPTQRTRGAEDNPVLMRDGKSTSDVRFCTGTFFLREKNPWGLANNLLGDGWVNSPDGLGHQHGRGMDQVRLAQCQTQ